MSWRLPAWMHADDQARGAALVQALRDVVAAGFAAAEALEDGGDLEGWRWRIEMVTGEARGQLAHLERFTAAVRAHAAQRAEERRPKSALAAPEDAA